MRWRVEIINIEDDGNVIASALEKVGYKLIEKHRYSETKLFLSHSKYEQSYNSHLVYQDSQEISKKIQRFFSLEPGDRNFDISFGPIHEIRCDGSIKEYRFLTGNIILPGLIISGILEPSEKVLQKQTLEKYKFILEQQRKKQISHLSAALENPQIIDIKELLSLKSPSPTELGHIIDIRLNWK